jgi:hypothetical protein
VAAAILLAHAQQNCDQFTHTLEGKQQQVQSSEYLRFFHWPSATYLTSFTFCELEQLLCLLKPVLSQAKT